MSDPLTPILEKLAKSGILSADDVHTLPTYLTEHTPTALAKHLEQKQLLTSYQARALVEGNTANLVLDEYLILDQLGAGGMGTVYKARHRPMDRLVALKVLPPHAMGSTDAVKRFHREVQAAAQLSHPNIVSAYDAGECNGVHYLVMELVDGQNLSEVVKSRGPLPVGDALEYTIEAARGLAHAHAKGIIHRDIKPSNLVLVRDAEVEGDDPGPRPAAHSGRRPAIVKILDMGLARIDLSRSAPTPAAAASEMTQAGVLMGTVEFMSPEQALDPKLADARSDIYSLGCTLYYLLNGATPYAGETVMIKLIAHREDPIPPLAGRQSDIPAAVDALYRKMVAKKPEDRFRSMSEVIRAAEWCLARVSTGAATGRTSDVDLAKKMISEVAETPMDLTLGEEARKDTPPKPPPLPALSPVVFPVQPGARLADHIAVADEEHPRTAVIDVPDPVEARAAAQRFLSRGANWMLSSAILELVTGVVGIAATATITRGRFVPMEAVWTGAIAFGATFAFVLVGSRQLRRARSRGLVIAGVVALVASVVLDLAWLFFMLGTDLTTSFVSAAHAPYLLLTPVTCIISLLALIEALRTLRLPEVRQAYGRRTGFQVPHDVQDEQARSSLSQGANWLLAAGLLILLTCVFSLVVTAMLFERRGPPRGIDTGAELVFTAFALALFFGLPAVFILVGASQLRRARSRGLVITAVICLFCLVGFFGIWLLIEIVRYLENAIVHVLQGIRPVLVVLDIGVCLTAALKGLITLGLPEVRKAFGVREPSRQPPRFRADDDWERRRPRRS